MEQCHDRTDNASNLQIQNKMHKTIQWGKNAKLSIYLTLLANFSKCFSKAKFRDGYGATLAKTLISITSDV